MTLAKLFILGLEIELLWTDMNYYREIRINGKPATEVMGGFITVCFATGENTDQVLRWMTKESEDDTWEEVDKMEKYVFTIVDLVIHQLKHINSMMLI